MHKTSDYNFFLPPELIAQSAKEKRSDSRLLVLNKKTGNIQHKKFTDIVDILNKNDVLVLNKSRVIPARICFSTEHGNKEILLSKAHPDGTWDCLVHPGKYFQSGRKYKIDKNTEIEVLSVNEDWTRTLKFILSKNESFYKWLQKNGEIPQPTYIEEKIQNPERYQTVFAEQGTSVAAPTAGLHFTEELFEQLKNKGIQIEFVHLDVGLGTFLPVRTDNILEHQMHSENFELTEDTAKKLNTAKQEERRIIAVGTTSVRVLESCTKKDGKLKAQTNSTNIFIYPGYQFKFVDALFTNFHTPSSTLLMLVSAFATREFIFKAYEEAILEKYQFYSFGDAMFIE